MYQKALDGFIGIKLETDDRELSGKRLVMTTICDMSTVNDRAEEAYRIAHQL